MTRLQQILLYGLIYPGAGISILALMVMIWGKVRPAWLKALAVVGLLLSAVRVAFLLIGPNHFDHLIFRRVGFDILGGINPYDPGRFASHPFLNPPSTFPLFALFAMTPAGVDLPLWTAIDAAIAVLLIFLAASILVAQDGPGSFQLGWPELGVLATVFALSDACMSCLELGQLPLLAALTILGAVLAGAKGRPALAGVLLGLGTMKIGTMLPFLLLFTRKSDRPAWWALALTVAGLCALPGHPERLVDQSRSMLAAIGELSRPGQVNDLSYRGPYNAWIIGFDHAYYRLGVRDPRTLRLGLLASLGLIGLGLARVARNPSIPRGLSSSLISLFSLLFLYHRLYDATIFALPLTYAVNKARSSRGRTRVGYAAAVVAMIAVLYMRRKPLASLTRAAPGWGVAGRIIEASILPIGTWATLAAMLLLWACHRQGLRDAPRPAPAAAGDFERIPGS